MKKPPFNREPDIGQDQPKNSFLSEALLVVKCLAVSGILVGLTISYCLFLLWLTSR